MQSKQFNSLKFYLVKTGNDKTSKIEIREAAKKALNALRDIERNLFFYGNKEVTDQGKNNP